MLGWLLFGFIAVAFGEGNWGEEEFGEDGGGVWWDLLVALKGWGLQVALWWFFWVPTPFYLVLALFFGFLRSVYIPVIVLRGIFVLFLGSFVVFLGVYIGLLGVVVGQAVLLSLSLQGR